MAQAKNNHDIVQKVLSLEANMLIKLDKMQGWPEGHYQLSKKHIGAIQAAYFSGRPLLVRGGAGLGKSQLAQAIASYFDWGLISTVIHYNTSIDELLYSIDHVKRLDDANLKDEKVDTMEQYLQPGKIWQAIAPDSLSDFKKNKPHNKSGSVLLIDEIDKADSTLPNALLEVLANSSLSIPYINEAISASEQHPFMVIITSNDERLLPQAFLRRCAVLDLQLPDNREEAIEWLLEILNAHYFDQSVKAELMDIAIEVANQVIDYRTRVLQGNSGDYLPGTSEFLDTIKSLVLFPVAERSDKLKELSEHLIEKSERAS